jgi:glycosyltransferase involved in cell wall biosynthesis
MLMVATVCNMLRDFLLPLAGHLRERGWRVDALARADDTLDECARGFDAVWDIGWTRSPSELRGVREQLRTVRRVVERGRYDLVHVHTPIAGLLARAALRGGHAAERPQVIYTAHGFHFQPGGAPLSNAAYLAAEKLAGRWTDYLVVLNRADEAAARRFRLVPPDQLLRSPGIGIDPERYSAEQVPAADVARVRAELGLCPSDALLLMVAEFTENKRHRDAVHALERLGRDDVHLAIAGRAGPALPGTRRLVADLSLGDRVHLLGFRDDIPALVRASAATVLLSEREGLPRSVMESMALGTPVIATRIRGVVDLLGDDAGVLVGVGRVDEVARAMAWVVDHPDEARELGRRGRARVRDFDERHVLAVHDELYGRALQRRALRRAPAGVPA